MASLYLESRMPTENQRVIIYDLIEVKTDMHMYKNLNKHS